MKRSKIMRAASLALVFVMILACATYAAPALENETSHTTQTLATGAVYSEIRTPQSSKYLTQCVHVVEVDLSQRNLYLDAAYGNMSNIFTGSTVKNTMTKYAQSHTDRTVLAGVNGAPWNVPAMDGSTEGATGAYGWSFGFTYINGEIYSSDDKAGDYAVGISEDYVPMFGMPTVEVSLTQGTKNAVATAINRMPRTDRIVVYTDRARGASNTNYAADDAYELLLTFDSDYTLRHGTSLTGTITAKYGPSDSTNPPKLNNNQIILTARGTAIADLEQFTVGQSITLDVAIFDRCGDSARWQKAQTIAGGFFPLILNGVTTNHNFTELYPATIVGMNRDGKFVMITVDGRNKNGNCKGLYGSNIHKYLMEDLGLYNALLLDGGGSATMVLNQSGTYTTVNVPTDGSDRSVKNAWILSVGPQRRAQGDASLAMLTAGPKNVDPTNVTFPDKYSISSVLNYNNSTDWTWENDALKLTATGGDAYVGFNYSVIAQGISANDYKYAGIVYKLPTTNAVSSQASEMWFGANGHDSVQGTNTTTLLSATAGKWGTAVFDASSMMSWNGTISSLRLDYFTNDSPGDVMYIHNIILGQTTSEVTTKAKTYTDVLNAPDQTTFKFNMHSHGEQIPQQTILKGDKAVRPADPTAAGYIFQGWYTTSVGNVEYDWDSIPYKNTTIHARWVQDTNATDVTLTFDMGGHGTQVPSQTFLSGGAPTAPADPTASGWVFDGWFTSATGSTPFNFAAAMTANTTAYAHWTSNTVTLSFDMGGHGSQVASQTLSVGDVPTAPAAPSASGWIFDGWFIAADSSVPFDFTAPLTEDATAYAQWTIDAVTLTFNMGGHGTQIAPQSVQRGSAPTAVAAPSAAGWLFEGWYTTSGGSTAFNFSAALNADAVAYAKWARAGDVDNDGSLNATDVLLLMRWIVGYTDAGFDLSKADYDSSGSINNKDVLKMMIAIVNGD